RETDTAHPIAFSRMPANDFLGRKFGVPRDFIEIGSELALVTDWNFDRGRSRMRSGRRRITFQRTVDTRSQFVERRAARRIKKHSDGRIRRRQFDYALNFSQLKLPVGPQHRVERFLGVETFDYADEQR